MGNSKYIKSGFWYIIGNIFIKGISFLTLPFFTRLLSVDDFGKFNLFLSYENIISILLGLGLSGTIRIAFIDYKKNFNEYFSATISLVLGSSIFVALIINFILFCFYNGKITEFWNVLIINFLILYSLATALYNLISSKYIIETEYKENLIISFLYTFVSIGLSLIFCYFIFNEQRYLARILGNALPLILITYSISLYYVFKNKIVYNKKYWSYGLKMGFLLIFHSLSLVIMQQVDKIMVDAFCGSEKTGIYSFATTISVVLTIILSAIDSSWAPWFYTNLSEKKYLELRNGNLDISILFTYLTIGFMLISPELVFFMGTVDYSDSIFVLVPLNISVYATFMYMFSVNKEYFHKKTLPIVLGTILATILDIILNIILIPYLGYIIAAYTTLISKVLLFYLHHIMSLKIDSNAIINIRILLILFVFVCFSGVLCICLKNHIVFRYMLIVLLTFIVFSRLKVYLNFEKT